MKTICTSLSLLLLVFSTSCVGLETEKHPVAKQYAKLSAIYEESLAVADYDKAFSVAIEQLRMDPSDNIAYLRMAIAAQHKDIDREKLFKEYSFEISERDVLHKQIKSIANALLKSKTDKQ